MTAKKAESNPVATIDFPTPGRVVHIVEADHAGALRLLVGIVDAAEDNGSIYASVRGTSEPVYASYLASGETPANEDGSIARTWRYPPRDERKLEVGGDGRVKQNTTEG